MKNDNEIEGDAELPQIDEVLRDPAASFLVEGRTPFGAGTRSGRCRQRRHGIGALAGQEMPPDHQRILTSISADSIPGTRSLQRRASRDLVDVYNAQVLAHILDQRSRLLIEQAASAR